MDYGIKVAKKGSNVNSTNPRDFTLHSGINMLKIYQEVAGVATLSKGVLWTRDITHNLGYKPMVFFFFYHPGMQKWCSSPCVADFLNVSPVGSEARWGIIASKRNVTNNVLRIRLVEYQNTMPTPTASVPYKVYIMADPSQGDWYNPATVDNDNASHSSDYGLKISRPGIDVKTAEKRNLVFSSEMNTFKIFRIIQFTQAPPYMGRIAIPHGLNYAPTFFAFWRNTFVSGAWTIASGGGLGGGSVCICADNTNIYSVGNGKNSIYVILCADPLNG